MLAEITEEENGITLHYTTLHSSKECDSVTTNVTLLCNRDQTGEIRLVQNLVCRFVVTFEGGLIWHFM